MENSLKTSISSRAIARDLLALGAVQFNVSNPFTWASGIKSPVYCDTRRVNSDVKIRRNVLEAFLEIMMEQFKNAELIAGVATGGMPMGALIADRLNLPFVYVRQAAKEHGLKKQVEGAYTPGSNVVLIEDLISTGGSSYKAAEALRSEKLELLGLISIMTYGFKKANDLFRDNKVNHYSLCDLDTLIDVASATGNIDPAGKEVILKFRDSV